MSVTLNDLIHDYLTKPVSSDNEEAGKVAKMVISNTRNMPQESKMEVLQILNDSMKQNKSTRSELLCKKICDLTKSDNWKNGIIGSFCEDILTIRHRFISYSNNINIPITKERFGFLKNKEAALYFGSTFATNKEHRLDEEGNHLLDAVYSARCYDRSGAFTGFALALADGAGGHFGDDTQDKNIAKTAYFATKSCVRFFSSYHQSEEFKQELPSIILSIKNQVQQKGIEGSTLISCRAFLERNGFRIIGFNIGDCMMIAWDPQSQKLYDLLPSHVSEAGTAIFPVNYRDFEVHKVDQTIPAGSLIFLLSDGVHDLLSFSEKEETYPNGLTYRTRHLNDIDQLFKDIDKKAHAEVYIKKIIKQVIQNIEELRKNVKEETQIGDDVSIIGCHLAGGGIFNSVFSGIKKLF